MPMLKEVEVEAVGVEPLLTRSEVARILGVSPTTVTRWAREGRLACRVTLGGHHRFTKGLIEEVRERMSCGAPDVSARAK
jgi:excisionase family DNA binding protein